MKKKKKKKKKKRAGLSSSKLFDLLSAVFRENPSKKFNYKQLAKILQIKELGIKIQLISVLETMENSGVVSKEKRGVYRLLAKNTIITSTIKNTSKSGVYANIDFENEVFISKKNSLFSLAGDEVEILLFPKKKNKQTGEVLRVLKRAKDLFVGIIQNSSSNFFLIPDKKTIPFDIFIPPKNIKKEFLNKKVVVKVTSWSDSYKNPVGTVVNVVGDVNDHDSEINSILYDYGFSPQFPKKIEEAANKIVKKIPTSEIKKRLDLRKTPTFTIDPEDAKDFDDALSVKKKSTGTWEIGVHIADVSYYVKKGGVIDLEAMQRASSVYLVDRVIPMLPEILSNNICSLKPFVDRLSYSVIFEMDEKANVLDYKISKTIIRSDFRFTYKSAQNIIDKKTGDFSEELLLLNALSKTLKKKRQKNGSINFEGSEIKFILDNNKKPINVFLKEVLPTNHLIEEFMLLANKTIAKHIGFPKKGAKEFVYRVHDLPDNEKIDSLNSIVKKLGHSINNKNPKSLSSSLNSLLKNTKGTGSQRMIETLTVRSMAKAVYDTKNIGHYGLAFDYYTHFTSPIRRYPDLIVHRLLNDYIHDKNFISKEDLEKLCRHCSQIEKVASKAERDSIKFMQVQFLKDKIGKNFNGIVSGVTEWGLYVELVENKCEGLVKISSIKNDHYIFDEKNYALTGYRNKISYQLGQKVKIKILKADIERRQMDFVLV